MHLPMNAAIAVGKNHKVLLLMKIRANAANASTARTASNFRPKLDCQRRT